MSMKIEPKLPTKNYNVSYESDSSLFFRYVWFFACIILCLYLFFISLSYIIVAFVSIEDEKKWFTLAGDSLELSDVPESLSERYAGSDYTIRIADMDGTENAFADLWGQVYITQELLDTIEYQEELDFIVWHEFGHIEHRDVLKGLVSDIPVVIILSFLGGDYTAQIFNGVLGNNYSKIAEGRADRYALDFTYKLNGHVWCALDFFEKKNTLGENVLELFSTHPITQLRIQRAKKYIKKMWYTTQECTPLNSLK